MTSDSPAAPNAASSIPEAPLFPAMARDESLVRQSAVAEAVAAERERCASLAESAGATYLEPCDDDDQQRVLHTHHRRPVADLIRQEPGNG